MLLFLRICFSLNFCVFDMVFLWFDFASCFRTFLYPSSEGPITNFAYQNLCLGCFGCFHYLGILCSNVLFYCRCSTDLDFGFLRVVHCCYNSIVHCFVVVMGFVDMGSFVCFLDGLYHYKVIVVCIVLCDYHCCCCYTCCKVTDFFDRYKVSFVGRCDVHSWGFCIRFRLIFDAYLIVHFDCRYFVARYILSFVCTVFQECDRNCVDCNFQVD